FAVDFYCAEKKLAIELDGGVHRAHQAENLARQEWLEERGVRVLRFQNVAISQDIEAVIVAIVETLQRTSPPGPLSAGGEGVPAGRG
ncbi:MAG TPA: DUF559 domain-containing protein, partial [bacterium]|nr:DUF559 domain-containing protein [bacterium]